MVVSQLVSCKQDSTTKKKDENHKEEIELAELMFHNQRYINKMYFAGKNQNWDLAKFYHHEIDENMEKILEGNIEEEGKNVSELARQMFPESFKDLEQSIASKDTARFLKSYDLVIRTCNNCHAASGYGFVKIKTPVEPAYKNQEY